MVVARFPVGYGKGLVSRDSRFVVTNGGFISVLYSLPSIPESPDDFLQGFSKEQFGNNRNEDAIYLIV